MKFLNLLILLFLTISFSKGYDYYNYNDYNLMFNTTQYYSGYQDAYVLIENSKHSCRCILLTNSIITCYIGSFTYLESIDLVFPGKTTSYFYFSLTSTEIDSVSLNETGNQFTLEGDGLWNKNNLVAKQLGPSNKTVPLQCSNEIDYKKIKCSFSPDYCFKLNYQQPELNINSAYEYFHFAPVLHSIKKNGTGMTIGSDNKCFLSTIGIQIDGILYFGDLKPSGQDYYYYDPPIVFCPKKSDKHKIFLYVKSSDNLNLFSNSIEFDCNYDEAIVGVSEGNNSKFVFKTSTTIFSILSLLIIYIIF